jgi:hypothetical protein
MRRLVDAELYHFPAIDPASFRRAVEDVTGPLGASQMGAQGPGLFRARCAPAAAALASSA